MGRLPVGGQGLPWPPPHSTELLPPAILDMDSRPLIAIWFDGVVLLKVRIAVQPVKMIDGINRSLCSMMFLDFSIERGGVVKGFINFLLGPLGNCRLLCFPSKKRVRISEISATD